MTTLSIKKVATAAILALGLGAAVMPVPAMAQSFGFSFGNDNGRFGFRIGDDEDNFRPGSGSCVSRSRLDDRIEDQGFRRVRITDYGRRTVEATGVRGNYLYRIEANACTGRIVDTDRLRRV